MSGSLVGVPITDHRGDALIYVKCWGGSSVTSPSAPTVPTGTPGGIRIPTFETCTHIMGMVFVDDPETPAEPFVFCTLNGPGVNLDASIDEAVTRNLPLVGYVDGYIWRWDLLADAETRCQAAGVRFLPCLMFYPESGESSNQYNIRIAPAAAELARLWPDDCGSFFAAYLQYRGPNNFALDLQQVLDCQNIWYGIARQHEMRFALGFSWRRPLSGDTILDGVLAFPELQEAARRLKAAIPSRLNFPTQSEVKVPQIMRGLWTGRNKSSVLSTSTSTSTGMVGTVKVVAKVFVPREAIPLSGVTGVPPPSIGGGQPLPPGGGEDPATNLPETAPNMKYVIDKVFASQSWRLAETYEDEPDGRGAFTEASVTALHDLDARWGHIRKNPGQNQYHGHAVDAIIFKNDDGTTAEIFDIVSGGSATHMWSFVSRDAKSLALWYYPA